MDFAVLIDWLTENWPLIVQIPTIGAVLVALIGKLGKAAPILVRLAHVVKDGKARDWEIAILFWMLLLTLWGLWTNPSKRVLGWIPDQQVSYLKHERFISADYRPAVKPVAPPKNGKRG